MEENTPQFGQPMLEWQRLLDMLTEMRGLLKFAILVIDGEGLSDCPEFQRMREIANAGN